VNWIFSGRRASYSGMRARPPATAWRPMKAHAHRGEHAAIGLVVPAAGVQPLVVGAPLVTHAQAIGPVVLERVGDEVAHPHDLGREVAVDVEHVVVERAVVEQIDLVELLAARRQHLPELGDVSRVHVRAAMRHGTARQQPQVLVGLAVRVFHRAPGRRKETTSRPASCARRA
jgi:hypothetical protein